MYAITPSSTVISPVFALSSPSSTPNQAWVAQEAISYGINPNLAECIIQHESAWDGNRVGDIGNPTGESFGWWQIQLRSHPDVTKADAFSLQSSTIWALHQIVLGNVKIWSTYSQKPYYCRDIPVFLN